MRQILFVIAGLFLLYPLTAEDIRIVAAAQPNENEYVMYISAYDWGAGVDKVVLNTARTIVAEAVRAEDFTVENAMVAVKKLGIVRKEHTVTAAYLCDADGNRTEGKGAYIAVELRVTPVEEASNPFVTVPLVNSVSPVYALRIRNSALGLTIVDRTAIVNNAASQFSLAERVFEESFFTGDPDDGDEDEAKTIRYVSWQPPSAGTAEKSALIVWFHGITEGGSNPYLPLFGAKVTNLISADVQRNFAGGAHILVPQSPDSWLVTTSGGPLGGKMVAVVDVNKAVDKVKKPITNLLNRFITTEEKAEETPYASVSLYTTAIKSIIDDYVSAHPDIDTHRIYVGGCSAGGYMTMNMLIQYPAFFAAAFPICEAYADSKITNQQIETLATIPLWFTHAKNDTTITPENHSTATVQRLRTAGAEQLHYVLYDDVHDTSGRYFSIDGSPYQYSGHDSWIYVLNNECTDGAESLFGWLGKQKK